MLHDTNGNPVVARLLPAVQRELKIGLYMTVFRTKGQMINLSYLLAQDERQVKLFAPATDIGR